MIKDGEESYTTNLCQQCCNESLVARGDKPLTKRQWYEFVQKKGASWKVMENDWKRTVHERDVGISLPRKIKKKKSSERILRMKGNEARKLSTVQEIMIRNTEYLRRIIAPVGGQGESQCPTCARIVTVFRWKTTFGGSQREKAYNLVVCDLWRKI